MDYQDTASDRVLHSFCLPFRIWRCSFWNNAVLWNHGGGTCPVVLGLLKNGNIAVFYLGNILSLCSSYAAAGLWGLEPMGYYFKPFTAYFLMAAISVFVMIIQLIPIRIYSAKKDAQGTGRRSG